MHCSQPPTLRQTTRRTAGPEGEPGPASRVQHPHKQRTLLPGLMTPSVRAHLQTCFAPNVPALSLEGLAILALPRFQESGFMGSL